MATVTHEEHQIDTSKSQFPQGMVVGFVLPEGIVEVPSHSADHVNISIAELNGNKFIVIGMFKENLGALFADYTADNVQGVIDALVRAKELLE